MLDEKMRLQLEDILEKLGYRGGGFSLTSDPGGSMVSKKKPLVWVKKDDPKKPVVAAAAAGRSKLIQKHLARLSAKQKKAEVIPFPKKRVSSPKPKRQQIMNASVDLSQNLEDIINDQREFDLSGETQAKKSLRKSGLDPDKEKRLSTARHRQLKKMMKFDARQRAASKQRLVRKQRAVASIGK